MRRLLTKKIIKPNIETPVIAPIITKGEGLVVAFWEATTVGCSHFSSVTGVPLMHFAGSLLIIGRVRLPFKHGPH